ncbi:ATP-binding protein [Telmatospirillum sp.]|uniref:hybrid sensor histidine kinase/response regulator n=1 Tax=Telmatospirillum sp. TaxID=2079197 RepID=UPI00283BECE7|nr:ATP-binding protein [Telmatospirillum sp.]MDR3436372.1 ATP-binding protein [Telmatospirillum sp.]
MFLPVALLIWPGALVIAHFQASALTRDLAIPEQLRVNLIRAVLDGDLALPIEHLQSLAHLERGVQEVVNDPGAVDDSPVVDAFNSLITRNRDYAKIRWVGETGVDRVRVDREAGGGATVWARDRLQDHHDSYEVRETLRLKPGEIYVSPLDLHVEDGRVEVPYRPTIRVGTRLFDRNGQPRGAFIIDISADKILSNFAKFDDEGADIALLNSDGYWLESDQPEDAWGFMFQKTDSFGQRFPQTWELVSDTDQGQRELADGLWTWTTVRIVPETRGEVTPIHWIAVSHLSAERLSGPRREVWAALATAAFLLSSLFGFGSWRLAAATYGREQAENNHLRVLKSITDNLPGMVGYWDDQQRNHFANRAYREWFGREPESMAGMTLRELLGDELYLRNEPYVRRALAGDEQIFERTLVRMDGSTGHTLAHYLPDRDGEKVCGFLVVVVDVTELKRAQMRLEELNDELKVKTALAEAASRAKSDFLANMSHEIRTPMNAILGLVQLLERQNLPPHANGMVGKIKTAGDALLCIINDILDFSKIEAHRLVLEQTSFRLSDVLANLAGIISSTVGRKSIDVVVGSAPDGVEFLKGDALRLGQVLINLAGNAIKFTERGEVVVSVTLIGADAALGRVRLRFSVRDTGIGIAKDKQPEIFDAFTQGDTSTTRRFGGTGLGLTISHSLVEMMGGELGLVSEPGKGSEFFFEVPFDVGTPVEAKINRGELTAAAAGQAGHRLAGLALLVVDDNELNREVAFHVLRSEDALVELAGDGAVALAMLNDRPDFFDLVLMDVQMPVMDGYAATRQIRATRDLARLPVVALTAGAFVTQRTAAFDAGFDDFVAKPFAVDDLVMVVEQLMRRRSGLPPAATVPTQSDPQRASPAEAVALIDVERGLRDWGEISVYQKYLGLFPRNHGGDGQSILEALAQDQRDQARTSAHKLRGAAGSLALTRVAAAAGAIEQALQAGLDGAELAQDLERVLAETIDVIDRYAGLDIEPPPIDVPSMGAVPASEWFGRLLIALDSDDPSRIEPLLPSLAGILSEEERRRLQALVIAFDFRGAEGLIRELRAAYGRQGAEGSC